MGKKTVAARRLRAQSRIWKSAFTKDLDQEREKQLRESLEVINQLLGSARQVNVVEAIREILRGRRSKKELNI